MSCCECKVITGEHDEWCPSHPHNIEIESLKERIEKLEEYLEAAVALCEAKLDWGSQTDAMKNFYRAKKTFNAWKALEEN